MKEKNRSDERKRRLEGTLRAPVGAERSIRSAAEDRAMGNYSPEAEDVVLSETMDEVKEPSMYRVLIHNDDYTSMEFVVDILQFVFNKSMEQATLIMLKVHNEGIGLCGVYTYEVAETKVGTVETLASGNGFPLKCSMERD